MREISLCTCSRHLELDHGRSYDVEKLSGGTNGLVALSEDIAELGHPVVALAHLDLQRLESSYIFVDQTFAFHDCPPEVFPPARGLLDIASARLDACLELVACVRKTDDVAIEPRHALDEACLLGAAFGD